MVSSGQRQTQKSADQHPQTYTYCKTKSYVFNQRKIKQTYYINKLITQEPLFKSPPLNLKITNASNARSLIYCVCPRIYDQLNAAKKAHNQ
ncbi:hypothetical protein M5D96_002411 [Drosophila gunungcola]|uniref:Uncharacterized protein n=1 Tax=Drosophila gunungcola TaxID=103775 RepID=A0A9P9YZW6_9MUSC|nr:hypothetical protein M5D96_002411 [Drosophila gunungcola]